MVHDVFPEFGPDFGAGGSCVEARLLGHCDEGQLNAGFAEGAAENQPSPAQMRGRRNHQQRPDGHIAKILR